MSVNTQVAVLFAGNKGFLDDLDIADVVPFRDGLIQYLEGAYGKVLAEIGGGKIDDALSMKLEQAISDYKAEFLAATGAALGTESVENEGN